MATVCPITGRTHRTETEKNTELWRLDGVLTALRRAESAFRTRYAHTVVPDEVGDAWNRLHDSIREVEDLRGWVEINPEPLTEADRVEWDLIQSNVDCAEATMRDPILPVDPLTGWPVPTGEPTPEEAAAEQAALDYEIGDDDVVDDTVRPCPHGCTGGHTQYDYDDTHRNPDGGYEPPRF